MGPIGPIGLMPQPGALTLRLRVSRFRARTGWEETPMTASKRSLIAPLFLIALGTGWLLTTLGIAPAVDWVWTLGLAVVGLAILAAGGLDKVTIVAGPLFLAASVLSVLRQTGRLVMDIEIPILVITAGILLLVARSAAVPPPRWISAGKDDD